MKTITAIAVAASLVTIADLSQAGAFYTEEELLEMAELVVDVEVTANACMGANEDADGIHRIYAHTLQTLEVVKGEADAELNYVISETEWSEGSGEPECSDVSYVLPAGWVGRLYLTHLPDGKVAIVDWGGAVVDEALSSMSDLPACEPAGGVMFPDLNPPGPGGDMLTEDSSSGNGCAMPRGGQSPTDSWMALGLVGLALAAARRRLER